MPLSDCRAAARISIPIAQLPGSIAGTPWSQSFWGQPDSEGRCGTRWDRATHRPVKVTSHSPATCLSGSPHHILAPYHPALPGRASTAISGSKSAPHSPTSPLSIGSGTPRPAHWRCRGRPALHKARTGGRSRRESGGAEPGGGRRGGRCGMRSPRHRRRGGTGQPPAPVSREGAPRLRPAANFAGESGVGAGSWEVGRGGGGGVGDGMGG